MDVLDNYRTLARYNAWFNERLYAAAATVSDEQRRRDVGAFFGSVHRTLNHIILCDHMWMLRLQPEMDAAVPRAADNTVLKPTGLDTVLYDDFDLLRVRRFALDRALEILVAGLSADDLDREVTYRMSNGQPQRHARWWALTHLFNHQTHHRGQVTTMLSQFGCDLGVTDLLRMLLEEREHA